MPWGLPLKTQADVGNSETGLVCCNCCCLKPAPQSCDWGWRYRSVRVGCWCKRGGHIERRLPGCRDRDRDLRERGGERVPRHGGRCRKTRDVVRQITQDSWACTAGEWVTRMNLSPKGTVVAFSTTRCRVVVHSAAPNDCRRPNSVMVQHSKHKPRTPAGADNSITDLTWGFKGVSSCDQAGLVLEPRVTTPRKIKKIGSLQLIHQ
ncbi:hypothetical protein DIPPA_05727 [Diplonema papillatum]|nr:hypothetical protein DIPPA_05727 [Diplonema papillatum]